MFLFRLNSILEGVNVPIKCLVLKHDPADTTFARADGSCLRPRHVVETPSSSRANGGHQQIEFLAESITG